MFEKIIQAAIDRRAALLERLAAEQTTCYRLFHGAVEGHPGVTLDRYGQILLCQTFRDRLSPDSLDWLRERFSGLGLVYRHRGRGPSFFQSWGDIPDQVVSEFGLRYAIRATDFGLDPDLFLDLRALRRRAYAECQAKSAVNFFAYTCGVGLAAAAGGARPVWNVDFSRSALERGQQNFSLNNLEDSSYQFVAEDCFPILWQLAGRPVKGKAARKPYQRVEKRQFDRVFLDPPPYAKSRFGAVDLVRDYPSLLKPCLALCAPGGKVYATNNLARVTRDQFLETVLRCAKKAGRPIEGYDWILPEEDFPSLDGQHPLKILELRWT